MTSSGDLAGSGSSQNSPDLQNQHEVYSQASDTTTITLSSPSQTVSIDTQVQLKPNLEEKECQTMDGVFLSAEEYALLLKKASFCPNFNEDLVKLRSHIAHLPQPEMDPSAFEIYAEMLVLQICTVASMMLNVLIECPLNANNLVNYEQWLLLISWCIHNHKDPTHSKWLCQEPSNNSVSLNRIFSLSEILV